MKTTCLTIIFCIASFFTASAKSFDADLIIYGDSSAAVTSAVAASTHGMKVIILSPTGKLGGLSSSGLGATDIGDKRAFGGLSLEFYGKIANYYKLPGTKWNFEPHAAEDTFDEWTRRHKIKVVRKVRLNREKGGVRLTEGNITSIQTENGTWYRGKMFIDATYEGDLLAAAGVPFTVGRESEDKYQESLNGNRPERGIYHQFAKGVDPYKTPGDPNSGVLPGILPDSKHGESGAGDQRMQAYCYRLCLTNRRNNQVKFSKPKNYDPLDYEILLRNFEAAPDGKARYWILVNMPNGKTDNNNAGPVSFDFIGQNYNYPEASYAERRKIEQAHRDWQMGLLWTLSNHKRVPEAVRDQVSQWGLARDEFRDTDNWPYQIYVREGRRMVSDFVMTQHVCQGKQPIDDAIAMGAYMMDSHHVRRYIDKNGHLRNEGDVQIHLKQPYPISYRSIVPPAKSVKNLLVPVCASASHIAYGSIRMEPVFMSLGHASGTAAAQAIKEKKAVQKIDIKALQQQLLKEKQILSL